MLAMEDLSGKSFGVYRIVEPLGRGGMASVYKAYQPAVDRYVALKVLPSHLAQDPEFLARFKQEAKMLAKLQHPHILPVHDFGESDGYTYIVMPFIKTGTLAARLTGHPLPFDQIKRVITQVGDALDCAHAQGLVHRDVKPSNILLDERGNCLLADFGIAKILEGGDTLTATGGLLGTPQYMSPEQGLGNALDGRSDVYSLGVVLYEMATGQVPYEAETPLAVVIKHIKDPLPVPSRINPDIAEPLQRMIFRAMHKEASERFATAGAMVEAMSAMPLTPAPSTAEPAVTVPMTGVPPLPTVAMAGPGGVDDVTVPNTVAAGAAPASMAQDTTVAADTGGVRTENPDVTQSGTSDMRRPVAVGVAALVALALLLFFAPWNNPETELTQAQNQPTPETSAISDTGRAVSATGAPGPDAEPTGTQPADSTQPATTTQTDAATSITDGAPGTTPATAATGELLVSVDTPSSVTVDGNAVGRFLAGIPQPITLPVGQHLVIATAEDGVTRDQAVVDLSDGARQVVVLELAAEVDRIAAVADAEIDRRRREAAAAARDPFPDQEDGTFLDRQTGFRWTVAGSPRQGNDGFIWTEADAYCEGLTLGRTSNWQLPAREELDPVLQRLDPERYPWGLTLWSASRPFGESNRLWVTNSPLYAPEWSTAVRDASARRLTHLAVCVAHP
jgi:serine/threonine protein kinase